ncbi:MAG TPA: phage tail protein [Acidimicrobiales bacterium]|jgi:phage tail-like protein
MATQRSDPYGTFNYLVSLGGPQGTGDEGQVVGGFSDVTGLGVTVSYSEYRNGNDRFNTPRKIANTYKNDDIQLKRGLIGSTDLHAWLKAVREGARDARTVIITLLDEARNPVATWKLRNAQPTKWVGPALGAKGGGEVAMEELHLVCEDVDYE